MTLQDFMDEWNGKYVKAEGGIGGQCVDLVDQYLSEVFGVPHIYADADVSPTDTVYGHSPDLIEWVLNDPNNASQIPPSGSVVVILPNCIDPNWVTGPFGHVDICVSPNSKGYVGFDQNFAGHQFAARYWHPYTCVYGWGIPKALLPQPSPQPSPQPLPPEVIEDWTIYIDSMFQPIHFHGTLADALAQANALRRAHPNSPISLCIDFPTIAPGP